MKIIETQDTGMEVVVVVVVMAAAMVMMNNHKWSKSSKSVQVS